MTGRGRIGVDRGLIGFFAVLYDDDGPIRTGIGRYATAEEAWEEARNWSLSENRPLYMPEKEAE